MCQSVDTLKKKSSVVLAVLTLPETAGEANQISLCNQNTRQ
jgi:hypothetical protein